MNRTNQILTALLAVQIIIGLIVFWPRPAAAGESKSLLDGLDSTKISRLTISDATGRQIQLAKGAGGWTLPNADNYPCQSDKVTPALQKLAALKTNRLVAQTEVSHKQLKVAEAAFERRVEIEQSDGRRYKLYVGTTAGYQAAYVRLDGRTEAYLGGITPADLPVQASGWIDTNFFSTSQDQVTAFSLTNKNGRLEFVKNDSGQWTLQGLAPGETADSARISSLLSRAVSISLQEPLGKQEQDAYGLKTPAAVVTLTVREGEKETRTVTLRVGAQNESDKSYVLASSTSPYYVRVAEYTVSDFVDKGREYFIQLPPTATPTPTAAAAE